MTPHLIISLTHSNLFPLSWPQDFLLLKLMMLQGLRNQTSLMRTNRKRNRTVPKKLSSAVPSTFSYLRVSRLIPSIVRHFTLHGDCNTWNETSQAGNPWCTQHSQILVPGLSLPISQQLLPFKPAQASTDLNPILRAGNPEPALLGAAWPKGPSVPLNPCTCLSWEL